MARGGGTIILDGHTYTYVNIIRVELAFRLKKLKADYKCVCNKKATS